MLILTRAKSEDNAEEVAALRKEGLSRGIALFS
jgi:hypothetical protein